MAHFLYIFIHQWEIMSCIHFLFSLPDPPDLLPETDI